MAKRDIKTITPKPNWAKLQKAETEAERMQAWRDCDQYVHYEVTDREYLHSTKKWIRDFTDWGVYDKVMKLPDTYLSVLGKHGWKAYKLGFMPDEVKKGFKESLFTMLDKLDILRARMQYEPPIHPSLNELDDDDNLHPKEVKKWIAEWKSYMRSLKKDIQVREYQSASAYVKNMETYLRTGTWLDSHYGEKREKKIVPICIAPAYGSDGIIKRTKGVFYKDIGMIWGEQDET
jgi:hypothetical protein